MSAPALVDGEIALDAVDGSIWMVERITPVGVWATHYATGYRTLLLHRDLVPVEAS